MSEIDHCFLGPKGEQRAFLKEMVSFVLDDYVFWRKNHYPKDPPGILYRQLQERAAVEFQEKFIQELSWLTSDLKLEVPFFSPRYFAHIVPEVSLPGIISYFATLLYNPNNISSEASVVTSGYELEVGKQFAALFEFNQERAFGHLTGGGTVANFEALWYARAAKYLPLTMALSLASKGCEIPSELSRSVWELLNISRDELEALFDFFNAYSIKKGLDPSQLLRDYSIHQFGERAFETAIKQTLGEGFQEPVVLLPRTAHYCWRRAMGIFGIGRQNIGELSTDLAARIDPRGFQSQLEVCAKNKQSVLLAVGVVGNTEFGAVDPVGELINIREKMAHQGLYCPLHIDAAFGGYFATMFREGTTKLKTDSVVPKSVQQAFEGIRYCESVTIDPHKMGYVPYGAGAVVFKHGFLKELITEPAPYALDDATDESTASRLGKYILEGSKPGAAAASVWFSHKMIPLNSDGFGTQLLSLCQLSQDFYKKMETLRDSSTKVELVPLFPPETNVLAFVVIPKKGKSLSQTNRLTHGLYQRFGVRAVPSIQSYDYIVSHTRVGGDSRVFAHPALSSLERGADEPLEIVRIVIMNRWLSGKSSTGTHYIDEFLRLAYEAAEDLIYNA